MTKKSGNAMNEDIEKPARHEHRQKMVANGSFGPRQLHQAERSGRGDCQLHVRSRREIRDKIAELERSGELPGLIEKAAAEAVDEPEDDNDTQGETAT
jgi:hypothetical protein